MRSLVADAMQYTLSHVCLSRCQGPESVKYCTKHLAFTNILENELFTTAAVQQRQHVDAVGCHRLISGLIGVFVFDILLIPSGYILVCKPPDYGFVHLSVRMYQFVCNFNVFSVILEEIYAKM